LNLEVKSLKNILAIKDKEKVVLQVEWKKKWTFRRNTNIT
jgi:hypothetical protein